VLLGVATLAAEKTVDAFGNAITHTGTTPNNYLYRGEQYDPDLGLYYLRGRYYNPQTGRFMSRDPEDGKIFQPGTLLKYPYAEGDPISRLDPTGRDDTQEYDALLSDAEEKYPSKVGKCEEHHIIPKYLGGNPNGATALIPAPYHQLITNAFRAASAYGGSVPEAEALRALLIAVYKELNLAQAVADCMGGTYN
jgi:RHS repeat-associated protein